jgi:pyridoxine 4-dehydrogenase
MSVAKTFTLRGDLTVNRLGFGAMRIVGPNVWGPPADHDEAIGVLRRAVELGVDFIDTADSYGPDVSEELIREALHPYRGVAVATKSGLLRPGPSPGDIPQRCGRPDYLRQQLHKSLRRLGVDQLNLWYLHRIDPTVDADDQFGVLKEAIDLGLVARVGLSEVTVDQIEAARAIVPIAAVQNNYNVANRSNEAVLEYCEQNQIGFIPFFPLAAGELARPGGLIAELAASHAATTGQIALAWLLHRSPVMLPIPGTSSLAHLEENLAASTIDLSSTEVDAVAAAVAPE